MVEQQRRLSLPPGYKPPRKGPSRTQVLGRRLAALAVAFLAALSIYLVLGGGASRIEHWFTGPKSKPKPVVVFAKPLRITFPEGFTRRDMAKRITAVDGIARLKRHVRPLLRADTYLAMTSKSALPGSKEFAGDRIARPLEGFLFPNTYDFTAKTTTRRLVQYQIATFQSEWSKLDLRYAHSHQLTGYDVLIIASLIEKEVVLPKDRPKIARLIYNRLHQNISLGIDATLRYGLNLGGTVALTPYLNSTNPYNTRKYPGLPPTPIANPGLASLQAATHPANGCWTYSLAYPDHRRTYFTCSKRDFDNHARLWGYVK